MCVRVFINIYFDEENMKKKKNNQTLKLSTSFIEQFDWSIKELVPWKPWLLLHSFCCFAESSTKPKVMPTQFGMRYNTCLFEILDHVARLWGWYENIFHLPFVWASHSNINILFECLTIILGIIIFHSFYKSFHIFLQNGFIILQIPRMEMNHLNRQTQQWVRMRI